MKIQLQAPKIWLASEAIDFRKGLNRLSEYVAEHFQQSLADHIYIFFNRNKSKMKLLACHQHGMILIYKCLHKRKFTMKRHESGLVEVSEQQLSWLLSGLDWVAMSDGDDVTYDDYF